MDNYVRLENESDIAKKEREQLRLAELDLMHRRESVAAMRRDLSSPTPIENYEFQEASLAGPIPHGSNVQLSELLRPDRSTIVYHLMLGKAQDSPCPMCCMWLDGMNAVARHLQSRIDLMVVAAASSDSLRDLARQRGWTELRFLSAGESRFKLDLGSEDHEGNQSSAISVLTIDEYSQASHLYTATPAMAEDQFERGIDLLSPVWNLLDLTPEGRGPWYPSVEYND